MESRHIEELNTIVRVKAILGSYAAIARICQVSSVAVFNWKRRGRFPRTDYTGETKYAETIHQAINGVIPLSLLLPPN
jgi:hypothetical protein